MTQVCRCAGTLEPLRPHRRCATINKEFSQSLGTFSWKGYWTIAKAAKSLDQWKQVATRVGVEEAVTSRAGTLEEIGRVLFRDIHGQ